jgi:cytochrome c-type biogenesis protein CcmH/NrfF
MNRPDWWINSGMAADAARELVWCVVVLFVVGAVVLIRDFRREKRNAQEQTKQAQPRAK